MFGLFNSLKEELDEGPCPGDMKVLCQRVVEVITKIEQLKEVEDLSYIETTEVITEYLLEYHKSTDMTIIWKHEYCKETNDHLTAEIIGWSYGTPSQFGSLQEVKDYISRTGLKAIFDL